MRIKEFCNPWLEPPKASLPSVPASWQTKDTRHALYNLCMRMVKTSYFGYATETPPLAKNVTLKRNPLVWSNIGCTDRCTWPGAPGGWAKWKSASITHRDWSQLMNPLDEASLV